MVDQKFHNERGACFSVAGSPSSIAFDISSTGLAKDEDTGQRQPATEWDGTLVPDSPRLSRDHCLLFTQHTIKEESTRHWREEMFYEHHPNGRHADPFRHPSSDSIAPEIPGYGIAANDVIDRLSRPPAPSGATPQERFGQPCCWYDRVQLQNAGISPGVMGDAEVRALAAEMCAIEMQKKQKEMTLPRQRKPARKRRS